MTATNDEGEEVEQEGEEGTKVSPEFQKEVSELLGEASLSELEYVDSQCSDMMKKLSSSQKKSGLMTDNFSTKDMPE